MKDDDLDSLLNRSLAVGGIGSFGPLLLLFNKANELSFYEWQMYVAISIFALMLGIVDRAKVINRKTNATSMLTGNRFWLPALTAAAALASFIVGIILSSFFALMFFLLTRR